VAGDIILEVGATSGLKVKVGDEVKKGVTIGISPDLSKSVLSPLYGVVEEISFDGQRHVFLVRIRGE